MCDPGLNPGLNDELSNRNRLMWINKTVSLSKLLIIFLFLFILLVLSGCAGPKRDVLKGYEVYEPSELAVERYVVGKSVQGRAVEKIALGRGNDVIFIIAGIHGCEPAGVGLVNGLVEHLRKESYLLFGRKVVILPRANPDGLAANRRFNARRVDLNRNFESANRINKRRNGRRALSEPESRIIKKLIEEYKPGRIVSIHQPLNCIDYDGPGGELVVRMSQYCDLPVERVGAKPGSLGSYAGQELGIAIITLELRKNDSEFGEQLLWERYGRALLAAIVYPDRPL